MRMLKKYPGYTVETAVAIVEFKIYLIHHIVDPSDSLYYVIIANFYEQLILIILSVQVQFIHVSRNRTSRP
jgi:hypothetical protein